MQTQISTLPASKSRRDEDQAILIHRFNGEFELPAKSLIHPMAICRDGALYRWRAYLYLDDTQVEFEAEGFYHDTPPKVWYEVGFDSLAETTPENLLSDCFAGND